MKKILIIKSSLIMVTGAPVPVIVQTQEKMSQTLSIFLAKLLHMLVPKQKSLTAAAPLKVVLFFLFYFFNFAV